MATFLQQVVNKINANPRNIFLIDGIGAVVSAFSLGVLLVKFENLFGMPSEKLYYLGGAAVIFALYSFTCYFRFPKKWHPFLKFIAITNLVYCSITLGLVIQLHSILTVLGLTYFILEIIVIITLVTIEFKVANQATK